MCRRQLLLGWILLAFGAGLLLGILLESDFVKCCCSIGCLVFGLLVLRK